MRHMEDDGELAATIREGTDKNEMSDIIGDVLAWLATIANVADIDLNTAVHAKYGTGCPGCGKMVCVCDEQLKP